jgi:zinc transport system substrate-binding protein
MTSIHSRLAVGLLALATATATACGLTADGGATADTPGTAGTAEGGKRVAVAAAFYPLAFISERVGGERVAVTNLTTPGAEPHDVELKPSQVEQLESADLVVYLRGFQPAVDDVVSKGRAFDVAAVQPLLAAHHEDEHAGEEGEEHEEHEGGDPHFWLDPTRLATVAEAVAKRLGEIDKVHAADYVARAASLRTELTTLDKEYADGLASCQRHEIVVSHEAFGYLADRYHLEQLGISGIDPESEPSPARLRQVEKFVREHDVQTIFFESLVSPKVAKTIADETGAKTAALDPIEGITSSSDDYFSVMRANLVALRDALGCRAA